MRRASSSGPAQGAGLETLVDENIATLKQAFPSLTVVEEREVEVDGRPARLFDATTEERGVALRQLTLIGLAEDTGYSLTAGVSQQSWDEYADVLEASLLSFEPAR